MEAPDQSVTSFIVQRGRFQSAEVETAECKSASRSTPEIAMVTLGHTGLALPYFGVRSSFLSI
jgi:hypothetical protein